MSEPCDECNLPREDCDCQWLDIEHELSSIRREQMLNHTDVMTLLKDISRRMHAIGR